MVATGLSSGSVRLFLQVLKLTSCGKKSPDTARSRHVNQGRFGQSHLLQRVSISLTNTGKEKLSGRLASLQRSSKMQDGMIISPSTPQGAYLQLKKLHILACSQMMRPLFMHFQTAIFFAISWAFSTPIYVRRKLP
jgi:hypothetical protein